MLELLAPQPKYEQLHQLLLQLLPNPLLPIVVLAWLEQIRVLHRHQTSFHPPGWLTTLLQSWQLLQFQQPVLQGVLLPIHSQLFTRQGFWQRHRQQLLAQQQSEPLELSQPVSLLRQQPTQPLTFHTQL